MLTRGNDADAISQPGAAGKEFLEAPNSMLTVRKVDNYSIPKYPTGLYFDKPGNRKEGFLRAAAVSSALLAALESSQCIGCTGPPPIQPAMVTENEARGIIDSVFSTNKYNLLHDQSINVPDSAAHVSLDGYDSVRHMGYEYITDADLSEYSASIRKRFAESSREKVLFVEEKKSESEYHTQIVKEVNDFIAIIRASGAI
jgi:hypothetical protein